MIIQSLDLLNYRNYNKLHMEFGKGINILYGDNAQGKTNVLESIYMCSTTKSHRKSKDREIIRFSSSDEEVNEAHIRCLVEKRGVSHQIDIHLKKNGSKGAAIDKFPIQKASQLFGILNVVFFSPEDLNIIKNGPSERRHFMDMELCQMDKLYLSDLAKYNKILLQRNHLLKEIKYRNDLLDTLSVWDMQLCLYGKRIIEKRRAFIDQLNEIIGLIHLHISGEKEKLVLSYEENVETEKMENCLAEARERDLKLCQTTVGPHRDDMVFEVNGIDIRKFGSQGQQRTGALSLKLSELELVKKITGDTPLLLLDDVLSELDSGRQNYLLDSIEDIQTIITCTGVDEFVKNRLEIDRIFHVVNGKIFEKHSLDEIQEVDS